MQSNMLYSQAKADTRMSLLSVAEQYWYLLLGVHL